MSRHPSRHLYVVPDVAPPVDPERTAAVTKQLRQLADLIDLKPLAVDTLVIAVAGIEDIRLHMYGDTADARDLIDGLARMTNEIERGAQPPAAETQGIGRVRQVRQNRAVAERREAERIAAHPHVCICARRFKSPAGLAVHQRSCLQAERRG